MNNKKNLVGKTVSLFLDGGWEIAGEVKSLDDDKFIVERDGNLYMVFKNKISCLLVSEKARELKPASGPSLNNRESAARNLEALASKDSSEQASKTFPMNGMPYDESGMSIPNGLLDNMPEEKDDDLSVFFQGGHSVPDSPDEDQGGALKSFSNIEFKTEDDIENQD